MQEFARMLSVVLSIYNMLIIVRILLFWFNPNQTFGQGNGGFTDILVKIVDPFLNWFKRITFLRQGKFDFTPLAALMVINIVQRILQTFAYTGKFSFGYTLATIVQSIWWSFGSLLLGILAVLLGVRIFLSYRRTQHGLQYISMLDSWLRRPMDTVHSWFFSNRSVSDRMLLWSTLIVVIVIYIVCAILVNLLVNLLASLPF